MDNFVQKGEVLTLTPPVGGVTGGLGYQIGQIFAVAAKTVTAAEALAGATFEGYVGPGVVEIVKNAPEAWTQGALIYWDDTASEATTVSTGNLLIGHATEVEDAAETTGKVRLDGAARDNEAT
jgi:predicted RecA/RadA family phage recombinase